MTRRGYDRDFAERCFGQIEGFGEYGFPESHAASFALLVYVSAWIKCHHPDVFCAAILNSQPMGFYQPAQLVRDAREHGVEIRPADVNFSIWDSTLEAASPEARHSLAVRLGFRQIKGLKEDEIGKLIGNRGNFYASIERLSATAGISASAIQRLAEADAFGSLDLDRRAALWMARRLGRIDAPIWKAASPSKPEPALPFFAAHMGDELFAEPNIALSPMLPGEQVLEDYVMTGLSLKAHPCSFFRDDLTRRGIIRNCDHRNEDLKQGKIITVSGLVLVRQRPGTSKGVVFMTLEDETGVANIIVWPKVFTANRRVVMTARFLAVRGMLQRAGLVVHVVAHSFIDLSAELRHLADRDEGSLVKSRDFH
jgi:error-prone DNA polymerase